MVRGLYGLTLTSAGGFSMGAEVVTELEEWIGPDLVQGAEGVRPRPASPGAPGHGHGHGHGHGRVAELIPS